MFTGLIRTLGTIRRVDQRGDCMVTIAMADPFAVEVGDSIACHGICLTATKVNDNEFKVALSAETLARSTAKDWAVGTRINLEPSLRMGDTIGGHLVYGHIDGVARVVAAEQSGDSMIWEFEVPPALAKFIAPKGSVTLDGVSLTVNAVREVPGARCQVPGPNDAATTAGTRNLEPGTSFAINIIPHTAQMTSFGSLRVGDFVNLEVDMLARYVARMMEARA